MKIVYAQGGVGNQLFQYAFYKYLQKTMPSTKFDIGRVYYDKQHQSVNISDFISNEKFNVSINKQLPLEIKDSFFSKVYRLILRKLKIKTLFYSNYDYDGLTELEDLSLDLKYFIGYFQFVDAAITVKEDLEREFIEKNKTDLLKIEGINDKYTGLHVRRGDFISSNLSSHQVISLDYIEKALSIVDGDIMVFSDDIQWCKKNLPKEKRIVFHEGKSALDDFISLSQCSNYILSGSTFSWWAAFLFSNDQTQVIIPRNHEAQFMSDKSNQKLVWNVRCL